MAQYIDKDTLVEEIDKVIDEPAPSHDQQCPWEDGYYCGLYKAESIIDTLEVKEVDLNFMLHEYWDISSKICVDCLESATMTKDEMINFAKHFFELGVKVAQKGE